MTNIPAVSVVLTVYNRARFAAEAIDSILAQTFTDFELIIVDDGSTDNSPKVIADYAERDSRVIVVTQKNAGAAAARNAGAAVARALYVMWMDDDDISAPDRMRRQWEFLCAHPDVAAVNCTFIGIDADGKINRRNYGGKPFPEIAEPMMQRSPPAFSDARMVSQGPSLMVRKSAFESIGGMRPFFPVCVDLDFSHRLEEKFPVAIIPDTLYHYRSDSGSQKLTKNFDFARYHYAAKVCALRRRRKEPDPVEEGAALSDIILLFVELPAQMRRNYIRQWCKSERKRLGPESYAAVKKEVNAYHQLFAEEGECIHRAERKIALAAFLRGRWGYFLNA